MTESKVISFFTFARSEYGLMKWTLKALQKRFGSGFRLFVGGAHLSRFYGETINEIRRNGMQVDHLIDFLIDSDRPEALAKSVGIAAVSIAQIFSEDLPDLVIVVGDRYELLSVAINAILFRIPIIHIAGGERTQGAIDEQIRHALTKLSHIHIVSTEKYAENVSRMGEEDWRIQVLGSPGIENIYKLPLLEKKELSKKLGINPEKPIILVTYHPVTLQLDISVEEQVKNLLAALYHFKDHQIVFTFPGAESESSVVVNMLNDFVKKRGDSFLFKSLGSLLYLSLMKNSDVVVGNSSSGIIEAPSLKVPTVNIGDRQKGRIRAESVIDCGYDEEDIRNAIEKAIYDENFRRIVATVKNPYDPFGDGDFSGRIVRVLDNLPPIEKLLRKDLVFSVNRKEWNSLLKEAIR